MWPQLFVKVHTTLRRLTSHATSLVFACFSAAESGQPAARPFDREFLVRRWEILGWGGVEAQLTTTSAVDMGHAALIGGSKEAAALVS